MSDQLCIDNQPSGSTQVFKIKARLNIQTVSRLKDLVITDEAYCDQPPPPPPVKQDDHLHLVFLVDTSDSFNKLDGSASSAGNVVLEKWVMPMLKKGQFHKRGAATTVTVIQFSGMGPDKNYTPGSRGLAVKGASLYHYKVEMGPVNFGGLDANGRDRKLDVLNDVDTIDGNGQLFLVLQDVAMSNFTGDLDKAAGITPGSPCKRYLVVVTDDEWDMNDLKISTEITRQGVAPVDASAKKRAIINFVKQKYTSIHLMCVRDQLTTQMDEFVRLMGQGSNNGNIFQIPRTDISNLGKGLKAVELDRSIAALKRSLAEFNLHFAQ